MKCSFCNTLPTDSYYQSRHKTAAICKSCVSYINTAYAVEIRELREGRLPKGEIIHVDPEGPKKGA